MIAQNLCADLYFYCWDLHWLYSISEDPQVIMMQIMFTWKSTPSVALETMEIITPENIPHPVNDVQDVSGIHKSFAPVVTYLSGDSDKDDIDDESDLSDENENQYAATPRGNCLPVAPPLKWCRLDIPYCMQHKLKWGEALVAIDNLLASKKTKFISGPQGLQAHRTLANQSHLWIVVKSQQYSIDALECAVESHRFAAKHGGQLLWGWTRHWMKSHKLPILMHGRHAKIYTLLSDHQLLLSSEHMSIQRSGQWIQPNLPNLPTMSSFPTQQQNISSISHMKRCPKVSKSILYGNWNISLHPSQSWTGNFAEHSLLLVAPWRFPLHITQKRSVFWWTQPSRCCRIPTKLLSSHNEGNQTATCALCCWECS